VKRKYGFDALNVDRFRDRVQQNFVQTFMTMMSIIQGLSFSFLMANAMQYHRPGVEKPLHSLFLIYPAISFFIMVLVLFFYSWFVSITYRPPSIKETFVPFFLGLFQVIPTYFLDDPKNWFFWNGVLLGMGAFGFYNTLRDITMEDFGSDFVDAYHATCKQLSGNMAICTLCSLVCFAASVFYRGGADFTVYDWLPCVVIAAILVFLGVRSERSYLQEIFRIYKLSD
jgi:hypothetical protein